MLVMGGEEIALIRALLASGVGEVEATSGIQQEGPALGPQGQASQEVQDLTQQEVEGQDPNLALGLPGDGGGNSRQFQ